MNKGLKEKILDLYKKGKTYNEIVDILGCSKGTISYHCRKNNLGKEYRTFSEKEKVEVLKLYIEERRSNKYIAEIFNVSVYMVKTLTSNIQRERITKSQKVVNWRKRAKLKLIAYFGGKCQLCGYDKCEAALEFHHKNPEEKDFTISGKSWSFERLLEEAKKCILVCSNCHSEIHAGVKDIKNTGVVQRKNIGLQNQR